MLFKNLLVAIFEILHNLDAQQCKLFAKKMHSFVKTGNHFFSACIFKTVSLTLVRLFFFLIMIWKFNDPWKHYKNSFPDEIRATIFRWCLQRSFFTQFTCWRDLAADLRKARLKICPYGKYSPSFPIYICIHILIKQTSY